MPPAAALPGCGYNEFQRLDEEDGAACAEVLNQYQRRADLVPNLEASVQGEAYFERQTLTHVIEARARATTIQVTPEMPQDPQALQCFQAAQGELGGALARAIDTVDDCLRAAVPLLPGERSVKELADAVARV